MPLPLLSVVTGVYNAGPYLRPSLASVLEQEGVEFELVVVDDGSTDDSPAVLQQLAGEYPHLRILRQENHGLTRALISGCSEARGEFIARHDAGDLSLPGRLSRQVAFLEANPEITLLSCWTRLLGPDGETLDVLAPSWPPVEATTKVRSRRLASLQGPSHHGSVMFRNKDYIRAGGYRRQFYYAQDLDLWSRLTDFGMLAFVPECLYEARFDEGCISSRHRKEQIRLARIALELAVLRQRGEDESSGLKKAEQIRPQQHVRGSSLSQAAGNYWIARMLQKQRDPRASNYFRRALGQNPFLLRAWLGLALSKIGVS